MSAIGCLHEINALWKAAKRENGFVLARGCGLLEQLSCLVEDLYPLQSLALYGQCIAIDGQTEVGCRCILYAGGL